MKNVQFTNTVEAINEGHVLATKLQLNLTGSRVVLTHASTQMGAEAREVAKLGGFQEVTYKNAGMVVTVLANVAYITVKMSEENVARYAGGFLLDLTEGQVYTTVTAESKTLFYGFDGKKVDPKEVFKNNPISVKPVNYGGSIKDGRVNFAMYSELFNAEKHGEVLSRMTNGYFNVLDFSKMKEVQIRDFMLRSSAGVAPSVNLTEAAQWNVIKSALETAGIEYPKLAPYYAFEDVELAESLNALKDADEEAYEAMAQTCRSLRPKLNIVLSKAKFEDGEGVMSATDFANTMFYYNQSVALNAKSYIGMKVQDRPEQASVKQASIIDSDEAINEQIEYHLALTGGKRIYISIQDLASNDELREKFIAAQQRKYSDMFAENDVVTILDENGNSESAGTLFTLNEVKMPMCSNFFTSINVLKIVKPKPGYAVTGSVQIMSSIIDSKDGREFVEMKNEISMYNDFNGIKTATHRELVDLDAKTLESPYFAGEMNVSFPKFALTNKAVYKAMVSERAKTAEKPINENKIMGLTGAHSAIVPDYANRYGEKTLTGNMIYLPDLEEMVKAAIVNADKEIKSLLEMQELFSENKLSNQYKAFTRLFRAVLGRLKLTTIPTRAKEEYIAKLKDGRENVIAVYDNARQSLLSFLDGVEESKSKTLVLAKLEKFDEEMEAEKKNSLKSSRSFNVYGARHPKSIAQQHVIYRAVPKAEMLRICKSIGNDNITAFIKGMKKGTCMIPSNSKHLQLIHSGADFDIDTLCIIVDQELVRVASRVKPVAVEIENV